MTITVTAWQPLAAPLIKAHEGCEKLGADGLYHAYPDPGTGAEPWTIGWGSTGPDIGKGTVWTKDQCDARFLLDLNRFGTRVAALIGDAPTTAGQMAALVSFAYNVGAGQGGLATSRLLRLHKAGDHAGAQAEFARWNKAGGKVLPGLTNRRADEAALYGRAA